MFWRPATWPPLPDCACQSRSSRLHRCRICRFLWGSEGVVVRRGHRIQNKVDCFSELPGTIFEPADASPSDSFGKQFGPFVWFHGAGQSGLAAKCVLSDRSRFEDCPVVGRHALRFGASLLFVISSACRGFPCRIWQPWSSHIGGRQA